jgi:hypothetical protein
MVRNALRVREDTGEIYVLTRGSSGNFEFGDPAYGNEKHHSAKTLVEKATLEDALRAIREGLHPRMKGIRTSQFNMISPKKVVIIDVPE